MHGAQSVAHSPKNPLLLLQHSRQHVSCSAVNDSLPDLRMWLLPATGAGAAYGLDSGQALELHFISSMPYRDVWIVPATGAGANIKPLVSLLQQANLHLSAPELRSAAWRGAAAHILGTDGLQRGRGQVLSCDSSLLRVSTLSHSISFLLREPGGALECVKYRATGVASSSGILLWEWVDG